LGQLGEADLAPLRAAAAAGTAAYAEAFLERVAPDPRLAPLAPVILYRTLPLADDLREGAAVLGLALKAAMEHGPSLERAGFGGPPLAVAEALFTAIMAGRSGVVFAVDDWAEVLGRVATPDGKLHLALPDMLAALNELWRTPSEPHDVAFPFVLSAGERRSFTANTIIRDPAWRKIDAGGALRMSLADAAALGVGSGDPVRLTTRRASVVVTVEVSDRMQRGHVSLPNGFGTSYPDGAGQTTTGVAPNELTAAEDRDPFVGTPWHKHVPARIERVAVAARARATGLAPGRRKV